MDEQDAVRDLGAELSAIAIFEAEFIGFRQAMIKLTGKENDTIKNHSTDIAKAIQYLRVDAYDAHGINADWTE